MAYTKFLKDKTEIIILNLRTNECHGFPLGNLLFSFLDLDLREYDALYKLCGFDHDFEVSSYNSLIVKYPKTAQKFGLQQLEKGSEDYIFGERDPDWLREYASVFLLNNEDTFSDIYEHPFFYFSKYFEPIEIVDIYEELDFYSYQQAIIELINYCLLEHKNPKVNNLTPEERYYLLTATKLKNFQYLIRLHSTVLFIPMSLHHDIHLSLHLENKQYDIDNPDEDLLSKIKGKANTALLNECNTIPDFLFFEFHCLLSNKYKIRRCKNCGKLFVLSGDYNTECCNRIPHGEKYTCKRLMTIKKRKEKVLNNPIIREYEKAYKRYYARVTNKKLSNEDFRLWTEEASKKREEAAARYAASPSEDIIKEFKEYLGNR